MEKEYITIKEAKDLYGYSHMTIYRFAKQGRLTLYHIVGQRQTLLFRSELAALAQPRAK